MKNRILTRGQATPPARPARPLGLLSAFLGLTCVWLPCASFATDQTAYFEKHCTECHDADTKKGGLDLSSLKAQLEDRATFHTWTKIHDRIESGEMPPKKKERPPGPLTQTILQELDTKLTAADQLRTTHEGRSTLRRLTRTEYENSLKDLFALPHLEVKDLLPPDGTRHGFDKLGEALDLSHVQLAKYMEAADRALDVAICTQPKPPAVLKRRVYPTSSFKFMQAVGTGNGVLLKEKQPDPLWPAPDRALEGNIWGTYVKNAEAAGVPKSESAVGILQKGIVGWWTSTCFAPVHPGQYKLRLSTWSFWWNQGKVEPSPKMEAAVLNVIKPDGARTIGYFDSPSLVSREHETTTWLIKGDEITFDVPTFYWTGLQVRQRKGGAAAYTGPGVALDWFEVEGPIFEEWPTASHRRLFGDLPIATFDAANGLNPPQHPAPKLPYGYSWPNSQHIPKEELQPKLHSVSSLAPEDDARRLLAGFLPRAFRRPVSDAEVSHYFTLVQERLNKKDCFELAMRHAYKAALTSTHFLFRLEQAGPLDDTRLAARLSYWLWNSTPDPELLSLAATGQLRNTKVLHAQIDRLLNDPKSERFVRDYLDQWLNLRNIDATDPDKKLYPEFQLYLKESMLAESRAFFRELLKNNLPVTNVVASDFAMLNQCMAEHYGIANVSGSQVRRVPIDASSKRGGFITQASALKVTANGTTSSPVVRGIWFSERILGTPVPPPPAGVPGVDPDTRGTTTIREQLDKHRADPGCAACHVKMDPPGFALESFDVIGGLRERYRSLEKGQPASAKFADGTKVQYKEGPSVDPSGITPQGEPFTDITQLRKILLTHPEQIARSFVSQMLTYATGAELGYADRKEVERIVQESAKNNWGIRTIIHNIAENTLFQNK